MRKKTQLVTVALIAGGLLIGASGTAMAVGNDSRPATPRPTATTDDRGTKTAKPVPSTTPDRRTKPAGPVPTATTDGRTRPGAEPTAVPTARPAKPVQGAPKFTG